MQTLILNASLQKDILLAAEILRQGDLVAIPTETVYGLAAPVFNEKAIQAIFRVKNRPPDNPLIVHCANYADIERIAKNIPPIAWRLMDRFSPGPLTLVLERHESVPAIVSAGLPTIAVRIPSHPVTRQLIELVGQPLTAPSANYSGLPSPTCAEHVLDDLNGRIAAVLDAGNCTIGIESTVLVLTGQIAIARPGAISAEELAEVLGFTPAQISRTSQASPISPGMKYRHYAPLCPVILTESLSSIPSVNPEKIVILSSRPLQSKYTVRPLSRATLYDELRRADKMQCQAVYVLLTDDIKHDHALMDRLSKAAVFTRNSDESITQ